MPCLSGLCPVRRLHGPIVPTARLPGRVAATYPRRVPASRPSDGPVSGVLLTPGAGSDRDHPGLETHVDGSEYSFSLPLNDGFGGGGTFFEYLGSSVRPRVGEALVHPGDLRHGGAPVVRGVRYVLVGFLKYK